MEREDRRMVGAGDGKWSFSSSLECSWGKCERATQYFLEEETYSQQCSHKGDSSTIGEYPFNLVAGADSNVNGFLASFAPYRSCLRFGGEQQHPSDWGDWCSGRVPKRCTY
jgi:hypothetical protein